MRQFLILSILVLVQTSCFKNGDSKLVENRVNEAGLSKTVSVKRKSLLSDVTYHFNIDLKDVVKSDSYSGSSKVDFKYKKELSTEDYLTIDFEGGKVLAVLVNEKNISNFKYNGHFLSVPSSLFKKDDNSIKINFTQNYSKTGSGLYKFKDTQDKKVYVYTDFEPYDANMFAPLFDQPNIKATYSLNVTAPSNWSIITSVAEQSTQTEDAVSNWSFPKSEKFSTYIFSLHGGPYKVWNDQIKLKSKSIPLRLFARQSLAENVRPEFWFKITKQGFNFFEKYFSTEYPYAKYDQVIVPDFNSGAMENVAAVTFNEHYVSKEKKPLRAQRRGLANVIFHEMAHMWFGNLVTMDWWNDLWLNESFATFMANTGLYYNTEYTETWSSFFSRRKQWGYSEDQWRTTHPIEGLIPSTTVATSSFDGITYAKGASSLKQLVFLIGEEKFKIGLADYFKDFSNKNTKRVDFINSLQKHTTEDLNAWTKEWLQTKGLNSVMASFSCAAGKLSQIIFEQGVVSGDEKLRTHKLEVAIWSDAYIKKPSHLYPIKIQGKSTAWIPKEEINCPKAVYPNWNDYAFIKVQMDEKSFDFISKNINLFDSKMFRAQFWASLKDMLKFGEIAPEKAFSTLKKRLEGEKDFDTASSILGLLYPSKPLFYYYKNQKMSLNHRKEISMLMRKLIIKTKSTDLKKMYFSNWMYTTYEDNPLELYKCLNDKCSFDLGFDIDVDKKWMLANLLSSRRFEKNDYVTLLLKKDSSRRSLLAKLASDVRSSKNKKEWLAKALDADSKISLKERNTIIANLIPYTQRNEYFKFRQDSFFNNINGVKYLPERTQRVFASNFSPLFCGDYEKNIPITEAQIKGSKWDFGVKKTLLKSLDSEERCLKIKAASNNFKKKVL